MPPGKDKEAAPSPEIGRLAALLAKDPKSRMFVPLAEEYIKAGMMPEAVTTLEEGLKTHPAYMSGRVMLGKALLQMGETDKAREQFEMVVKAIPDNLFAYRKLAEIYKTQGRYKEAIGALRVVVILDPADKESKRFLDELQAGGPPPVAAEAAPQEVKIESHRAEASAPPAAPETAASAGQAATFDISEVGQAEPLEEVEEVQAVEAESIEPEPVEPEPVEPEAVEPEVLEALAEAETEEQPAVIEMPVPEMETLETVRMAEPTPKTGYAIDLSSIGIMDEAETAEEVEEAPVEKEVFETETLAELYIKQGFYDRAVNIYRSLLLDEPNNAALKQKLEDLYLLAGVSSAHAVSKKAEEEERAGEVFAEPVMETAPAEEVFAEPMFEAAPVEEIFAEPVAAAEPGAVRRLESFLQNIRRKANR